MNYERAVSIPAGLIGCRIDGIQLRIEEITPCSADLLCDCTLPDSVRLAFSFYHPESGSYKNLETTAHKNGQCPGKNAAGAVRFVFDDADCAAEIRRSLQIWSEYVNMRISGVPESFAEKYLSYPKDTDDYHESIKAQYAAWFSGCKVDAQILSGMETALMIDLPSLWEAFADLPFSDFIRSYVLAKQLPEDFFANIRIDRLYIGSEHCFHLFPDEKMLSEIVRKAEKAQLKLTFNTSIIHQSQLSLAKRRIEHISDLCPDAEIVINDWGMLNIVKTCSNRLVPIYGTILNRFRRDSRMQWKAGIGEKGALLNQNALNDSLFYEFVCSLGMTRFEYAAGTKMELPEGAKSLHFPFYPTNTSAYCPLKAYIETGERGKQAESACCPVYCENNAFLYPKALNMIHRMCSILTAAQNFPDESYLSGFDRLVFNF